jgi:hypothetical protein
LGVDARRRRVRQPARADLRRHVGRHLPGLLERSHGDRERRGRAARAARLRAAGPARRRGGRRDRAYGASWRRSATGASSHGATTSIWRASPDRA